MSGDAPHELSKRVTEFHDEFHGMGDDVTKADRLVAKSEAISAEIGKTDRKEVIADTRTRLGALRGAVDAKHEAAAGPMKEKLGALRRSVEKAHTEAEAKERALNAGPAPTGELTDADRERLRGSHVVNDLLAPKSENQKDWMEKIMGSSVGQMLVKAWSAIKKLGAPLAPLKKMFFKDNPGAEEGEKVVDSLLKLPVMRQAVREEFEKAGVALSLGDGKDDERSLARFEGLRKGTPLAAGGGESMPNFLEAAYGKGDAQPDMDPVAYVRQRAVRYVDLYRKSFAPGKKYATTLRGMLDGRHPKEEVPRPS